MLTPVATIESDPDSNLRSIQACFGRTYATGRDVWTDEPAMRVAADVLLDELGEPPRPGLVVDVGAGRGRDLRTLARAGHRVVGLDLVAPPEWRTGLPDVPGIRLVQGSPDCLHAPGAFDAALDNGCLHHQHPDRLPGHLAAIGRLLRPGGVLVASVFHPRGRPTTAVSDLGRLNREIAPAELDAVLALSGLVVRRSVVVPRADGRAYRVVVAGRRP